MDKETLEEAAENKYRVENTGAMFMPNRHEVTNIYKQEAFIDGANWQQERMYSEEEVKFIISEALQSALVKVDLEQWFNQFHKKNVANCMP
jgi:hypothetical protein